MAIPIKEYIDIAENVVPDTNGIELVGLVISSEEMVSGATQKTAYDAGTVLTITRSEALASFANGNTKTIINAYNYNSLKVIKKLSDESYTDAFNSACDQDGAFCAFVCDSALSGTNTSALAVANAALGSQHLFIAAVDDTTKTDIGALTNKYLLKVYVDAGDTNDFAQIGAVLGWAASIDHTASNGASTLMYKDLGVQATVTSLSVKSGATGFDAKNINYCGLVQTHGATRKFFQMGKCADGVDAGVVLSSIYMTAVIENGWIDLAMGAKKIPANRSGAEKVRSLVIGVAETGVKNGAILIDKPLTNTQINEIRVYTGNANAEKAIQSIGYYTDASITLVNNEYVCTYTLVYAKGDHVAKVSGSHFLV